MTHCHCLIAALFRLTASKLVIHKYLKELRVVYTHVTVKKKQKKTSDRDEEFPRNELAIDARGVSSRTRDNQLAQVVTVPGSFMTIFQLLLF